MTSPYSRLVREMVYENQEKVNRDADTRVGAIYYENLNLKPLSKHRDVCFNCTTNILPVVKL